MSTETTIKSDIQQFGESLPECSGQPESAYMHKLKKGLTRVLYAASFDKEHVVHNLCGLIMDNVQYKALFGELFPSYTAPPAYPPDLDDGYPQNKNDKAAVVATTKGLSSALREKSLIIHKAQQNDWKIYSAAFKEIRVLMTSKFDDTYINELEDEYRLCQGHPNGLLPRTREAVYWTPCSGCINTL